MFTIYAQNKSGLPPTGGFRFYFYMHQKILFKFFLSLSGFIALFLANNEVYAADLVNASNTITTSRPSASSPFLADAASGDTLASIFNNGSFYLASDSAQTRQGGTGTLMDTGTIISSQSAALTTVYFGEQLGVAAGANADVLIVPITAMHRIRFTIPTEIPANGDIVITFPSLATGDANNEASPSASTFQFNNMDANDGTLIQIVDDGTNIDASTTPTATNSTGDGDGPDIHIATTSIIAAGSVVDIYIGCSAAITSCSAQVPTLINPTKTAVAGTANVWKINVQTRDATDVNLDNATIAVGTIDSVAVRATVDPTLSFTITGVNNGLAVNTGNTTGCLQTETTNAGAASTSTEVNLGLLANAPSGTDVKVGNIATQRINISTNGAGGYVLTATSSGQLINPATGFFLASATTPTAFPASGADWFGIHACGLDVTTATWNSTASTACNTYISGSTDPICLYGWPTQTTAVTLASDATGPVGNSLTAGNGVVSVAYAAATDAGVPPGEYRTVITYVATPAF